MSTNRLNPDEVTRDDFIAINGSRLDDDRLPNDWVLFDVIEPHKSDMGMLIRPTERDKLEDSIQIEVYIDKNTEISDMCIKIQSNQPDIWVETDILSGSEPVVEHFQYNGSYE